MRTAGHGQGASLLEIARSAAQCAYSRYSGFPVGAAVLAEGRVFSGCNIENASYGLTVCAERVAIFAAVAACHRRIDALAVTCPQAASPAANLRMPCGACRQVIAEFASPNLVIFVDGVGEFTLDQLLPSPFGLEESRKAEPPVE